jgi:heme exporter protein D
VADWFSCGHYVMRVAVAVAETVVEVVLALIDSG